MNKLLYPAVVGATGALIVLITLLLANFTGNTFTPEQSVVMFLLLTAEILATVCGAMYTAYLVEDTDVFDNKVQESNDK